MSCVANSLQSYLTNSITQDDIAERWYVIHTHPRQERRADENLRAWGLETFSPLISVAGNRSKPAASGTVAPLRQARVPKPLFPGYIFARFDCKNLLHKVRFTRGIHHVVSFGDAPIPVDNELIGIIRARIGENGFVRLGEELNPNDKVLIESGPFTGFMGVFEKRLRDPERVLVLLSTITFQARIQIDEARLKKLA
jgi:transcriptional antiterminator RfaH